MTHVSQPLTAPRYTSYPTAPHFGADVKDAAVMRWRAAIPKGEGISLYIHIPYCDTLCWFCACRTQGGARTHVLDRFLDGLECEIAAAGASLPEGVHVARVHLGGGSPSVLSAEQILRLGGALREAFRIDGDADFAVEVNPVDMTAARMDAFAEIGMTRASIGVQDFSKEVQAAINRPQNFEVTREAVEDLRDRGVRSVNLDLVYGLPLQGLCRLRATVGKAIALRPDRIALFGYAHVPWMARRQKMIRETDLPGHGARMAQEALSRSMFRAAGYREIGLDHFAAPGDGLAIAAAEGRLRRNFQGYTDDLHPRLIGLGPSAISRYPEGYAQNIAETAAYLRQVEAGGEIVERGKALTLDDQVRGRAIEHLMCHLAFDEAALRAEFGDFSAECAAIARTIADSGAWGEVTATKTGFRVRPEARRNLRLIASQFDAYLPGGAARHSRVI